MPLGKYYCDYCDKQFQDTPFHRKRHLQGLQHHKAKALWYASIPPDPNQVPLHSSSTTTGVCNRFIRTGSCPYGDNCKYFHPNQSRNMQGFTVTNNMETQLPNFSGSRQPIEKSSLPGGMMIDRMGGMVGNLPPSLRPPPEGGYPPLPFVDWG